jgi:hypothetical protein
MAKCAMLRDPEFVILSFGNLQKCPKMLPRKSEKWPEVWFGGCAVGYTGLEGLPVFVGVPLGTPLAPGAPLVALTGWLLRSGWLLYLPQ